MMIISGCEYGRVKNFPDWEDNLRFSCAVTNKLNSDYPGIMRPILFSERKYNMDLTKIRFCSKSARTETLLTRLAIPADFLPPRLPI